MKGFLMATGEAIDSDSSLHHWIDRALAFNPLAKSSKKNNGHNEAAAGHHSPDGSGYPCSAAKRYERTAGRR